MSREALKAHFSEQAGFCEAFGSPFTAQLISRMGDDLEAGGPIVRLVGAWPTNPRADALALRLTGALHYAVLSGRAPALADVYPAARPDWRMDEVWPAARRFLEQDHAWTRAFIESPPQTNETRRAIGLLTAFLTIASEYDGPLELLELGASAGLNLNWDSFAYRAGGWAWNEQGAPLIDTDWTGPAPPLPKRIGVRARAACDQNPLDVRDPRQRLQLKSYIWPDQPERLARFDAAADLAALSDTHVERADAADWLAKKLSSRADDAATVVYHSVFFQYPPRETRNAITALIEAAGAAANPRAPLYWVRLEPEAVLGGPRESVLMVIDLVSWPGGERRILATTDGHVRAIQSLM